MNHVFCVTPEVVTAVLLKVQVFWDVIPYCQACGSGCLGALQHFHIQGSTGQRRVTKGHAAWATWTLKMRAL
jgi:hypothetical protein